MPRLAIATLFVGLWGVFFGAQVSFAGNEDIAINEVYYDAPGSDTGYEFIELYNNGTETVDLTGWDIDPSTAPYNTLESLQIEPQQYLTVFINKDGSGSNMSNTKGPIALFSSTEHSEENLIDYIAYGESGLSNETKAVAKGLWQEGKFLPDVEEGYSLSFDGNEWFAGSPTPGEKNGIAEATEDEIEDDNNETANREDEETAPQPESHSSHGAPDNNFIFIPPIIINEPPVAVFSIPDIELIDIGIRFDASDSSDDNGILSYLWDFGTVDGMSGRIAEYRFASPGEYKVTLSVFDDEHIATTTRMITITDDPSLVPLTVDDIISQQLLRVSEVLPNPTGSDLEGEWAEIENVSDRSIDISSWNLDDKDGGSKPYSFPKGSNIAPHELLIIDREESKLAFNNTIDDLRLLSPDGIVVDAASYVGAKEGKVLRKPMTTFGYGQTNRLPERQIPLLK